MFNDVERQKKAYLNAIELVKILIKYHGFNINQVKRHYDWTKKDCPQWLIAGKFGYTWAWFKNQCKGVIEQPKPNEFKPYIIRVIYRGTDGLNIRKDATTKSNIVDVVFFGGAYTIVEEKNGFGLLKSGLGWISLNSKYVQKI